MVSLYNYKKENRYIICDDCRWDGVFPERYLVCNIKSGQANATLCLKGIWADEQFLKKGTRIGIVGVEMDEDRCFVVDKNNGYLVIEPDFLLSITSVVSAYFCERKTVFNERMRLPLNNRPVMEGIIAHEMLGRGMMLGPGMRTRGELLSIAWNVTHTSGIMLKAYALGMSSNELSSTANSLVNYVLTFLHERYDGNRKRAQSLCIENVVDIEDTVWSPTFGLKGKMDATVTTNSSMFIGEKFVSPLEFKTSNMDPLDRTGKVEHIGQVQLYALLMSERYKQTINPGILYYLKPNTFIEKQMDRNILQALIITRNRLTIMLKISNGTLPNLPRPYVSPKLCGTCDHRITCSLLSKMAIHDPINDLKNKTEEALIGNLEHLCTEDLEFFNAWFTVITSETQALEAKHNTNTLWTMPIHEREKTGRCISQMEYVSSMNCRPHGFEGLYSQFSRSYPFNFEILEFQVQDMVVLSTDKDLGFMYGIVVSIDPPKIILKLERLSTKFTGSGNGQPIPVTIDKVQSFSPMMVQYGYLQALMADTPRATTVRNYVINKNESLYPSINPQEILAYGPLKDYNRMQREVIVNAIRTDSFLFVKGMPGTGKTVTIVALLKFLTKMGKTVLVSAYTGTAVDNILIKCFDEKLENFIRVGEPKIRHFSLVQRTDKAIIEQSKGLDDLKLRFDNTPIIGTTLLNLKHEIFQVRKFDYLIVDEASQALPSAVFGALLLAERCIFVGDPDQLPTVSLTSITRELTLEDNFFTMLATDQNTKVLTEQYRMNETIMALSNQLVYGCKMTAHRSASKKCLRISSSRSTKYLETLQAENPSKASMMKYVLSRELDLAAVFLNTAAMETMEVACDTSLANAKEARLVVEIANVLITLGSSSEKIGVIAPYRGQVNLIRSSLSTTPAHDIEVNTVDQYQGRDKEIILVSFTKTRGRGVDWNLTGEEKERKGCILEDMRRLNVAITRAKVKLIMVGDESALSSYEPLKKLFAILNPSQMCEIYEDI